MPLYAVERELCHATPEQLQRSLRDVVSVCTQFSLQGKKVRYISSVLLPTEQRGLCLFGAEDPEWVKEVQEAMRIPYSRIIPLLDFTPSHVKRHLSRRRRSLHDPEAQPGPANPRGGGGEVAMSSDARQAIARWLEDGQRLFGSLLERIERLEQRELALERKKEELREPITRLQHDNEILQAQREELLAALHGLAGHVTQAVDEVLQRFGGEKPPK
jgi:hypothetical protein